MPYLIVPGTQEEVVEYGILYNWYAAADVRNISADRCHLPSKRDFSIFNKLFRWMDIWVIIEKMHMRNNK